MVEPECFEEGRNASDSLVVGMLEDTPDDPTPAELLAALEDLDDDEIVDVLALLWLGRGDHDAGGWREALGDARGARGGRAVRYLLEAPTPGDLLAQELGKLGHPAAGEGARS